MAIAVMIADGDIDARRPAMEYRPGTVPLPPLLSSRPVGVQVLLANVLPCLTGAVCGVLLGVSGAAYLLLSVLAIGGGYFAGLEHRDRSEGLMRGVLGGLQFGAMILLAHELEGSAAKADLPHPAILLVVVTTGFGALLGWLGGRARERRLQAATPPPAV